MGRNHRGLLKPLQRSRHAQAIKDLLQGEDNLLVGIAEVESTYASQIARQFDIALLKYYCLPSAQEATRKPGFKQDVLANTRGELRLTVQAPDVIAGEEG